MLKPWPVSCANWTGQDESRIAETRFALHDRIFGCVCADGSGACAAALGQHGGSVRAHARLIVDELLKLADIGPKDQVYDLGSCDGASSLFEASYRDATVVTLYLLPRLVTRLVPKLREELRPGSRIVSHDYPLSPWPPDKTLTFDADEKEPITGVEADGAVPPLRGSSPRGRSLGIECRTCNGRERRRHAVASRHRPARRATRHRRALCATRHRRALCRSARSCSQG